MKPRTIIAFLLLILAGLATYNFVKVGGYTSGGASDSGIPVAAASSLPTASSGPSLNSDFAAQPPEQTVAASRVSADAPPPNVASDAPVLTPTPTATPIAAPTPTPPPDPREAATLKYKPGPITVLPSNYQGRMQEQTFYSPLLKKTLKVKIYLPPNYDNTTQRYPVLYMLHGLSGSNGEWVDYGLFDIADKMIRSGKLPPMIIVLPPGEQAYWLNWPDGGPRWGDYVADDMTGFVDVFYRTIATRGGRAIGGHSMGGHGSLQIAFNHPDVFGVIGAHSPTLRTLAEGKEFNKKWDVNAWGDEEHYAIIDPVSIAQKLSPEVLRSFKISLDVGDKDEWQTRLITLHKLLLEKDVPHGWSIGKGGHGGEYWIENVANYLTFYANSLEH